MVDKMKTIAMRIQGQALGENGTIWIFLEIIFPEFTPALFFTYLSERMCA